MFDSYGYRSVTWELNVALGQKMLKVSGRTRILKLYQRFSYGLMVEGMSH